MSTPAPRLSLPRFVQKGRAETLTMPIVSGGATVPPTAGTFSLLDADGAAVIDAAAVTITGGAATYSLASTFADGYSLPLDTWREVWALTGFSLGPSAQTFENEVHVCRTAPVSHCTLEDLYRLHSQWRRQIPQVYSSNPDQPVEMAWEELLGRLLGDGHLPNRVLNWWALSVVHRYWAAHIVSRDFQTDQPGDSRWARLAEEYWKRASDEYEHHLGLQIDSDEDGVADTPGVLDSAEPPLFLTAIPTFDLARRRCR